MASPRSAARRRARDRRRPGGGLAAAWLIPFSAAAGIVFTTATGSRAGFRWRFWRVPWSILPLAAFGTAAFACGALVALTVRRTGQPGADPAERGERIRQAPPSAVAAR